MDGLFLRLVLDEGPSRNKQYRLNIVREKFYYSFLVMLMVSAETDQTHDTLKAIFYKRFSKSTAFPDSLIPTKTVILIE